jgi:hypothetical protein
MNNAAERSMIAGRRWVSTGPSNSPAVPLHTSHGEKLKIWTYRFSARIAGRWDDGYCGLTFRGGARIVRRFCVIIEGCSGDDLNVDVDAYRWLACLNRAGG